MQPPSLEGRRVCLRPLTGSDFKEDHLSWINDPEVTRYLEVGRSQSSLEDLQRYAKRFLGSGTDIIFGIIDRQSESYIGNVTLNHIDLDRGTADTGLMIGRKEFWGRGYALEVWSLVIDYAFQRLGLRKIIAGAVADNIASIKTLQKLGFRVEGTLRREFLLEGEYLDTVRLGLFQDEFQKIDAVPNTP